MLSDFISVQIGGALNTIATLNKDRDVRDCLEKAARICLDTINSDNKIMLCGNGGSAAQSQHIAAELVGKYKRPRPGLSAIALSTDTSIITALGNDYGFDSIFSRQIEAIGGYGDSLIVYSTSGNSKNILNAITYAKAARIKVIGFTGEAGGLMHDQCDVLIKAPSRDTARIQEIHLLLSHVLCMVIEETIFGAQDGIA